jgi:hypothetical protein
VLSTEYERLTLNRKVDQRDGEGHVWNMLLSASTDPYGIGAALCYASEEMEVVNKVGAMF